MTSRARASWLVGLLVAGTATGLVACKPGPEHPLGPPDSYLLLAPVPPAKGRGTGDVPLVSRLDEADPAAMAVERLLADGFASEMVRTVYLAKEFARGLIVEGRRWPQASRAATDDALYMVLGAEGAHGLGRGLAVTGSWFGGPSVRPDAPWIGLPASVADDPALVQTLAGRLATYVVRFVVSAGSMRDDGDPRARPLVDGYRWAMEVIAREWRVGRGPAGVMPVTVGSSEQRELFAKVRENRFVVAADSAALREPAALLADPGVVATIVYRMAQARELAQSVANDAFYAPVASTRIPPGVSPAAVFGPFRNFQAKLLGTWEKAVLHGRPPQSIADLVTLYGAEFPREREAAYRIFIVTTYGATMKPGGVSTRAADATAAMAELTALTADAVAGKRPLVSDAVPK